MKTALFALLAFLATPSGAISYTTGGGGGQVVDGALISPSSINATGTITANEFVGGGAGLTGVSAAESVTVTSSKTFTGQVLINAASPSATSFSVQGGNAVYIGTNSYTAPSVLNISSAAAGGALLRLSNDGGGAALEMRAFGTGAAINTAATGRRARGSVASPAAVQNGDIIMFFGGRGYAVTNFSTNNVVNMQLSAAETFTDTSNATRIVMQTTNVGSIAAATRFTVESGTSSFTTALSVSRQVGVGFTPSTTTALGVSNQVGSPYIAKFQDFATGENINVMKVTTGLAIESRASNDTASQSLALNPQGGNVAIGTTTFNTSLAYCAGGTFAGNVCRQPDCICTGGTTTSLDIFVK